MQPYVDQYRPSFCPPTTCSPKRPIAVVHGPQKNRPESRNSSSSSSDKDSLMSNERNITKAGPKCGDKTTEMDRASMDHDGSEHLLPSEEGNGSSNGNAKTDEQDVVKPSVSEHHSNVVSKQQKTFKNTMTALKDRKVRESGSPMRGNRIKGGGVSVQKTNTETFPKIPKPNFGAPSLKPNLESPTIAPTKATPDSAKLMQGPHPSKHQVHYH